MAERVEAVGDHMLLQLMAYVALLVASKMSETIPLQMKSLASLTGRMFTPIQVDSRQQSIVVRELQQKNNTTKPYDYVELVMAQFLLVPLFGKGQKLSLRRFLSHHPSQILI